jgi:iron complex transport system substrate-binding protein
VPVRNYWKELKNRCTAIITAGLILLTSLFCTCKDIGRDNTDPGVLPEDLTGNRYARSFTLADYDSSKVLTVTHPWQNAKGTSFKYVLLDSINRSYPDIGGQPEAIIRTPVKRIIVTSTTHISFISELGRIDNIIGISGHQYIYDSILGERIKNQLVFDIGYDQNLNYELIISLKPDVIFAYGVTGEINNQVSRLRQLGIPVVLISEYLEEHPLGKAEWIRVFAAFLGQDAIGDSLFLATMTDYEALVSLTSKIEVKPDVLSGLPWNDTWFVPGGRSFAARLINDAGGNYLWKDNDSFEALPLDIESVYKKACKADYWINPGAAGSKQDILSVDSRLGEMKPFIIDHIYNNNARVNSTGGNDYWESGVTHPDQVLMDLVSIFHPEMVPVQISKYYRKI